MIRFLRMANTQVLSDDWPEKVVECRTPPRWLPEARIWPYSAGYGAEAGRIANIQPDASGRAVSMPGPVRRCESVPTPGRRCSPLCPPARQRRIVATGAKCLRPPVRRTALAWNATRGLRRQSGSQSFAGAVDLVTSSSEWLTIDRSDPAGPPATPPPSGRRTPRSR